MYRFFIEQEGIRGNQVEILGGDVKHIRDVLRLGIGDEIEVACRGIIYRTKIKSLDKKKVLLQIIDSYKGLNESLINITLYQGLAKGNKMDMIFQKGTELGVKNFYPVATGRSIVKINNIKKEQSKVRRWNNIVDEAGKQSKRDILPKVEDIISFKEMIEILRDKDNIIVPYEEEKSNGLKSILQNIEGRDIHIIIGPEGGFDSEEIFSLKEIGAKIVSLGPRILRTETAGLATSSMILYELGDMGEIL